MCGVAGSGGAKVARMYTDGGACLKRAWLVMQQVRFRAHVGLCVLVTLKERAWPVRLACAQRGRVANEWG